MNFLQKILSALAGMILYSIKSLIVNLLLPFFVGLALILIIPALVFFVVAAATNNMLVSVFAGIITFLVTPLIVTPVLLAMLVIHTIASFFSVFKSIGLGAIDGYKHGFFSVVDKFFNEVACFSISLSLSVYIFEWIETNITEGHPPVRVVNEGHDLPHDLLGEPQAFDDLTPEELVPLTPEEIESVKINGDEIMKERVEQYENLYNRLNNFDNAFASPEGKRLDEGTGRNEIIDPYLFVKEYSEDIEGENWRVVPSSTLITDYTRNLLPELQRRGTHPHTRDSIRKPSLFENYPRARYRVYPYTDINHVHELINLADFVQKAKHRIKSANTSDVKPEEANQYKARAENSVDLSGSTDMFFSDRNNPVVDNQSSYLASSSPLDLS